MKKLFYIFAFLPALLLLAACNGVSLFSDEHSQQMDRLEAAMAQCASTSEQSQLQLQLQRQAGLLEVQAQKLDVLSDVVTAGIVKVQAMPGERAQPPQCIALEPELESETELETEPQKMLVGRHEQVWIENIQLALPARVDTGAETASLDARNIEMFERNGKRWVRFEILHPDSGEALQLERKLRRTVSIIQSNSSEPERRPVIKLGIVIGHVKQSAEFTLSNRSHLDYQMLVGRNILKDIMIVDVSKINVAPPVLSKQ